MVLWNCFNGALGPFALALSASFVSVNFPACRS